jgi:hypothetical protein
MNIIEIRPHRKEWKVFECPGVEPVFQTKEQALGYAQTRAGFSAVEIRIIDSAGEVQEILPVTTVQKR